MKSPRLKISEGSSYFNTITIMLFTGTFRAPKCNSNYRLRHMPMGTHN
jgi:hypothetical protein